MKTGIFSIFAQLVAARAASLKVLFPLLLIGCSVANGQKSAIAFAVSMDNPASHTFHVRMTCEGFRQTSMDFKMPVWTPGYYQRLDFAKNVENFRVTDGKGNELPWEKPNENTWRLQKNGQTALAVEYDVKATRPFVATPYLDAERGYILPAGVFLFPSGMIGHPLTVEVRPYDAWKDVATGLEPVAGKKHTFTAPDFDILYDSPLLAGNLESLPSFTVKGIPHRFIGFRLGDFDKAQFMNDLKKIVETATDLIGDIPYKQYTFIAIGPGMGGIEHLNSTTVSFNGSNLLTQKGKLKTLFFLAHEYFHHYNVKRIRPIELGPFDYDNGNRTNMLWVSEGLSVYYEYLTVQRAGLCTRDDLLNAFQSNILAYEGKPGRLYQSLTQASYETWSDGPFGRTGDELNKTISYYDKGPVVGMMLDFAIRHATGNRKSLDDVMRSLYKKYYQKKKRGFTETEFKQECERLTGSPLSEVFDYTTTTKELNYKKYLGFAGLDIDTTRRALPGGWSGIQTKTIGDTSFVTSVDRESPAWQAGLRAKDILLELNGQKAAIQQIETVMPGRQPGESIELLVWKNGGQKKMTFSLGQKMEASFRITRKPDPDALQRKIFDSWLK